VVADLHDEPKLLQKIGLSNNRLRAVRDEVGGLCGG